MSAPGGFTVWVVVPAFDEARAIRRVLEAVHGALASLEGARVRLVVVDDGSRDATAERVEEAARHFPVTLLRHDRNRGLGAALATGLRHVAAEAGPEDVVVTTEADGTQPAEVLPPLVAAVRAGADLAVATPLLGRGFRAVPAYRRVLSHGANLLYRALFRVPGLRDYTNLVRAIPARHLRGALAALGEELFDRSGFEAVPDLVLKLRPAIRRVVEVPLEIDFSRLERASSMRVGRTILASLALCARHLVRPPRWSPAP